MLDFGTCSPNRSEVGSLNPLYQNHSMLQHHLLQESTRSLHGGLRGAGFLSVVSFLWRGGPAIVLFKPVWKVCRDTNLGLESPGLCFDLGVRFTASLFLSSMSGCCIFVVISTGVCCAQADVAVLPDPKHRRPGSPLAGFESREIF